MIEGSTELSLNDTIQLVIKEYGHGWRSIPEAVQWVMIGAQAFTLQHIRQVLPDYLEIFKNG